MVISHVTTGTIFFICSTSSIQLSLLRSEVQLDWLHQNYGEKDAGTERRQQDCGKSNAYSDEPDINCLDKLLIRLRRKARGYSKHLVDKLDVEGNLTQEEEIQNPTQRRVLKEG